MRLGTLFLLTLLWPALAGAEVITLDQALREASGENPQVLAARARAEAASAALGEARSRYWPRITLQENYTQTNEPATALFISLNQEELVIEDADYYNFPPSRKDFETTLQLSQPLFNTDIYYSARQAEAGARAAELAAAWGTEEMAFAAFRAYLNVQQAHAALDWVASSLEEAEEIHRLSTERYQAGTGLKADVLRARVFLSEAQRRQVAAENNLAVARSTLAVAMGRPPGTDLEIAGEISPDLLAPPEEIRELHREDLQALHFEVKSADLARARARAEWLPQMGVSASYSLHDSGAPFGTDAGSWRVGAGLSWTLFDGGQRRYSTARAAAEKKASAAQLRSARHQALLAYQEAVLRAREAQVTLEATRDALDEAEESYRLTQQRFEAGLVEISELLSAQTSLDRVRYDRLQAQMQYLLALGNARFQRGAFTEDMHLATEENSLQ